MCFSFQCSQTCGGGTQTRRASCLDSYGVQWDGECVGPVDTVTRRCGDRECAMWQMGEWGQVGHRYSRPSILHPFILRPPLIKRPIAFVPKCHCVLNALYFKTTCNIRPHDFGPLGGL